MCDRRPAARAASASSARPRPCSPRIAGCRPRAISRSSSRPGAELLQRLVEQRGAVISGLASTLRARDAQLDGHADQVLLGAVVEVALEAPALLVARLDDAGARGDQVRARLRAGDGERDELAERAEPVLGVRGQRVLARDRDRAPERARDDDRRGGGGAVADAEDRLGDLAVVAQRLPAPESRSTKRFSIASPTGSRIVSGDFGDEATYERVAEAIDGAKTPGLLPGDPAVPVRPGRQGARGAGL